MRQTSTAIHALPESIDPDVPTVGAIKRAFHELSRTASGSTQGDEGAMLREAHDLLRRLARRDGIDPDAAVRQRRAAIQSQREQLVFASAAALNSSPG